jgi:hypothetical protein
VKYGARPVRFHAIMSHFARLPSSRRRDNPA